MSKHDAPPPWTIETSERLGEYAMFSLRHERVRAPRDDTTHDFYVVEAKNGVTVVALTPERELVLVEQYRVPLRAVCLETPSGIIEEDEEPVQAALRELREETGFAAEDPRELGRIAINPSWDTGHAHVVLVRNARRDGGSDLDPGEDTRVRVLPLPEVWEAVRTGRINAGVVVSALHLFRLHEAQGGAEAAAP